MSDLVDENKIIEIVGSPRHESTHLGRAVSVEQTVYVLHSNECKASGIDLRDCEYSLALDNGIDVDLWAGSEDRAVELAIAGDRLIPVKAL